MDIIKKQDLSTISLTSDFYLTSPSDYAKIYFYYMLSVGHFYCKNSYCTSRKAGEYNSYLLIYVLNGRLNIVTDDFVGCASSGDTVLLNCYQMHSYSATEPTEFYYIHFDGINSSAFTSELLRLYGNIYKTQYHLKHSNLIYEIVQKLSAQAPISECDISATIHIILCDLLTKNVGSYVSKYPRAVNDALSIFNTDYSKKICISDVAKKLNTSEQHLIRSFKSYLGVSPYKYLSAFRINIAALLLKSTDMTISEITENIGFSSESNFIKYFYKVYGATPSKYRKS